MKAIQILGDISSPEITTNRSMTKPVPKNSELLVAVHAAGITGDEIIWPEPYATPTRIPGHDISGVISSTGPEYQGPLQIGQEVYAYLGADQGQGQADYVICLPSEVALKPTKLSHAEAAALPIPLLTAWEALFDHGALKAGMKVLVTGASGAVGTFAIQFAAQTLGVHVIALASSRNHEMLRRLGASEVHDYGITDWEKHIADVDVVFDTVGGDVLKKTWNCVKDDGVIVTVGDPAPAWAFGQGQAEESADHPNVRYVHFIVSPNAEILGKAGEMIDSGSLEKFAVKTFPFDEAKTAWDHAQRRNRGYKVVIDFIENSASNC
ncbi:uncharacterized protein N7484_006975 [Penicillium longicatenatum]|uniref:uncharacterized protein n=1 Tax=Penicillium longicatenatum TaxID=1561947 RepID=UPI002546E898|nr:uncharacterized protein N7484_006975 [Penicillium longicatenatum]KAJ5639113.1 hypothetical protein N7484_006975 [Penicillium longicatenatum]